jgi:hypothetical protein
VTDDYDDSTGWVVVGILTDPDASDDDLRDAVAMANPAEVREAQRRVRLLGGAHCALCRAKNHGSRVSSS